MQVFFKDYYRYDMCHVSRLIFKKRAVALLLQPLFLNNITVLHR